MIEYYKEDQFTFDLNEDQKKRFNDYFKNLHKEKSSFNEKDFDSIVYRYALLTWKFMMILSILRNFENKDIFKLKTQIECDEIDFENAFRIIEVYFKHTEIIYKNLSSEGVKKIIKDNKEQLFEMLNDEFKRNEVLQKAEKLKVSRSTIDRLLKRLIDNKKIEKISKTVYKKIK